LRRSASDAGVNPQAQDEMRSTASCGMSAPLPSTSGHASRSSRDWCGTGAGSLRIVGAMSRAGVPLLAGSDVNNPHVFPGFALHDELALFVEAGLSPEAALTAATVSPARYFGATDSLGTIAVGKLADLVLLDADPLADIRNTRRIRAVVLNGRLLERTDLIRLLARARTAAEPQ
jgi:imidazolonepropionase-like amidohydrolase